MNLKSAIPVLPVTDMEEGVRFYRDVLGFAVAHQDAGYAVLARDRVEVHLWLADDESWRTRKEGDPVQSGAESFLAGTHSCRISVEGVDQLHRELEPKGILHPNAPLAVKPWGAREFGVLDPYGNLVNFFEWPR